VERARRRNQKSPRNGHGQKDENRFEQESRAFFTRVRHGYLAIARRASDRVVVIDARGTPAQTHVKILDAVLHRFRFATKVH
jgi:thymidylate kinase